MPKMSKYSYVDVSTKEVVGCIDTTSDAAERSLPVGCEIIEGWSEPGLYVGDYTDPANPFLRAKTSAETLVTESDIKAARDKLELSSLVVGVVPYDVDRVSLERMGRAVAQWDNLSMTIADGKISWIAADNTVSLLTKIELTDVKAQIDLEIAKRSDRLFYHCGLLISQLPNITKADIADENWPLNA